MRELWGEKKKKINNNNKFVGKVYQSKIVRFGEVMFLLYFIDLKHVVLL